MRHSGTPPELSARAIVASSAAPAPSVFDLDDMTRRQGGSCDVKVSLILTDVWLSRGSARPMEASSTLSGVEHLRPLVIPPLALSSPESVTIDPMIIGG